MQHVTLTAAGLDGGYYRVAPELVEGHELDLAGELEERLDLRADKVAIVVEIAARHAGCHAWHLTCEAVRQIAARLQRHSSAGAALSAALGLNDGESLSQMAGFLGCSKQNLHNISRQYRDALPDIAPAPVHPIRRPVVEGQEFVSRVESAALTGFTVADISKWPVQQTRVNGRVFYRKNELLATAERIKGERLQAAAVSRTFSNESYHRRQQAI